jgi:hypothetical protein
MPLNYRRGFQRLYAAMTVTWIAFTLFMVPSGRWEPWRATERPPQDALDRLIATVPPDPHWLATTRWTWAAGLSVGVPLGSYALLFLIAPWVTRGFRPVKPAGSTHATP